MSDIIKKLAGTTLNSFSIGLKANKTTLTVDGTILSIDKTLAVDTINEKTTDAGVTIETVLIKDGLVDGVDVSAHDVATTGVHGVTGTIVGTTDTQTLTNKTIDVAENTVSNIDTTHFATNIVDTDAGLTANSDTRLSSQKAIKAYVDATAQGLIVKDAVRVATTANITLSGEQTIDGIAVVAGDRVLVKNQTDAIQNGIYDVVAGEAWTRSEDFDGTPEHEVRGGCFTFVQVGTTNASSGWVVTGDGNKVVGTDAINLTQFSGAGQIEAGDALSKTGNQLDVNVDDVTVEVNGSNNLAVKDDGITKEKINVDVAGDGLEQDIDGSLKVNVGDGLEIDEIGATPVESVVTVKLDGVTLSKSATGLKVTDDTFQPLDGDLTAIAALETTGIIVRTATDTVATRTITGTTDLITITNGDGVAGAPTINIGSKVVTDDSTHTLTNKTFDANGTGNSISNLEVADFATGVVDTDLSTVSASDDTLASAKAVRTAIDNAVGGGSKLVSFDVATTTAESTYSVSEDSVIESVRIKVTSAYSVGAELVVSIDGTTPLVVMASDENDAETVASYVTEDMNEVSSANAGKIKVTVSGTPVAGACTLYVKFAENKLA